MTKTKDRLFAGFGAALFLASACVVTVVAIISGNSQDPEQTAQNPACELSSSIAAASSPVPETFKPEGDVTKLESTTLEAGTGAAVKSGDCVQVKYSGTLAKDGTFFDGNFDKPTGLQFPLGQGSVIPGWDQGVVGAKIGETRRLVIPSELAYGDQASGSIPANSDLVFVVKILGVTK